MPTYEKVLLSESADGRSIPVDEGSITGTYVHTPPTGTSSRDEVWLYAVNTDTDGQLLTLVWGGLVDPDDLIELTIPPASGLYLIAPGLLVQNSAPVRAFAATVDVVNLHGFVNRITD